MGKVVSILVLFVATVGCQTSQRDTVLTREYERHQNAWPIIREMFDDLSSEVVAVRLWSEISDGTVRMEWGESHGDIVGSFSHDGGDEVLQLNQRYVRLAVDDEREKFRLETFLFHEAIHHRQYHDHPDRGDVPTCTEWWLGEREAYVEQCSFARRIGVQDRLGYCSVSDPRVFRHNLLARLMQKNSRGPACMGEFHQLRKLP